MGILVLLLIYGALLYHIWKQQGFGPILVCGFLLFVFGVRLASALYVSLAGPVYSEHFDRFVRDDGLGGIVLVLSFLVVTVVGYFWLSPKSLRAHIGPPPAPMSKILSNRFDRTDTLSKGAIIFFTAYVVCMYADMLWRGTIPLFTFMERNTYTDLYAGYFHKIYFDFTFLFNFLMGFFFVRKRIFGGNYDTRYLRILVALYVYFLLTGHRFSAFFGATAFFLIPVGCLMIQSRAGRLMPSRNPKQMILLVAGLKKVAVAMGILLTLIICYSLYNSLFAVRNYSDPVQALVQRTLVQPSELWWASWESSIRVQGWDADEAVTMMFKDPIDATRNTGIQYLMVRELGYDRANELLTHGEQYAGGYPEVLFEILGPIMTWPIIGMFAILLIFLLRTVILSVCNQRIGTATFSIFLFYGLSILYVGGMLNSLLAKTLLIKIALLVMFLIIEHPRRRRDFPRKPVRRAAPPWRQPPPVVSPDPGMRS